jgi:hypothetical protein
MAEQWSAVPGPCCVTTGCRSWVGRTDVNTSMSACSAQKAANVGMCNFHADAPEHVQLLQKVRWHTEMCRGDTSKHRERVGMSTRSTASADTIRCQHGEMKSRSACVPCWLGLHTQTHIAVGLFVQPTPRGCAGGAARPRDLRPLPAIWQWAGHQTRSAPCGT